MNHSLRILRLRRRHVLLAAAMLSLAAGCGDGGSAGSGTGMALLAAPAAAAAATDQLAVTGLQKTAERRVGRTVFEYTFKVTIKNNGTAAAVTGATAQLTSAPAGTTIVDGKVAAGAIAAGASVTPDDPIVLRVDRSKPFDSAALVWQVAAAPAASAWTGVRQDVAPYPATAGINNNFGKGSAVATDAQGNVIIVGTTTGAFANVANPEQSSGAFVAKYSPSGQLLWGRRILDQGNIFGVEEGAYGVGVDRAGNIYVTGETLNALPGEIAAGNLDVFIARFDSGGNRAWAHQFGSNQLDQVRGIAVDAQGNAVIVGYSSGQLPLQPPPGGEDFFVAKYDSAGNRVFLHAIDLGRAEEANGVALDAAGNIYVAGTTAQQAGDFAGTKGFVVKFNGGGAQQWLTLIGETAFPTVFPNAIAVAADGVTVYLAGHTFYNFDTAIQDPFAPDGDAFVARLNGNSGARSWIHNLSSGTLTQNRRFDDTALGVATDPAGSAAFITGYTPGAMPGETSKGAEDLFVARYASDGTRSWVRQLGSGLPVQGAPNDRGYGITLDPAGDLFVTGSTIGTFGATPRNIDRSNWFVFKMKPADGSLY